jgi:hypothetical protein
MWWMLLVALENGMYRSEIVVKTEQECVAIKTQAEDQCVPVKVFAQGVPAP